jgi:hypothetical protein
MWAAGNGHLAVVELLLAQPGVGAGLGRIAVSDTEAPILSANPV